MKVLVTGAGGFLGQGLIVPFLGKHELRLMDVADWQAPQGCEKIVGDVADLETVHKAVQGCQAIVIAHMASRQAGSYETPTLPFDANVKGTANLFFEGVKAGIKKYVLISGEVVVMGHPVPRTRNMPLKTGSIYGLTKVCQEVIAEQFQREHKLQVAALRVGYILSADDPDNVRDKYGKPIKERNRVNTDRRDIGLAAVLALDLPDLAYETFFIMGAPEGAEIYEMEPTYKRLGWKPKYDFTWQPLPKSQQKP